MTTRQPAGRSSTINTGFYEFADGVFFSISIEIFSGYNSNALSGRNRAVSSILKIIHPHLVKSRVYPEQFRSIPVQKNYSHMSESPMGDGILQVVNDFLVTVNEATHRGRIVHMHFAFQSIPTLMKVSMVHFRHEKKIILNLQNTVLTIFSEK